MPPCWVLPRRLFQPFSALEMRPSRRRYHRASMPIDLRLDCFPGTPIPGSPGLPRRRWLFWADGWVALRLGRGMKPAKTVIGLLHGAFSIGAASGPFLANAITSAAHKPWYNWYYVLTAFVFLELPCLAYSFWQHDVESFHVENGRKNIRDEAEPDEEPSPQSSFSYTATWIGSAYVSAFMGVEFTVTGWGIAYMNRVNEGSNLLGGLASPYFTSA
ncbi:hypothetical protein V2G26_010473 [Clonostachys chloroleuca]